MDIEAPARRLAAAAMLILAKRNWAQSPDDEIAIIELGNGFRVDVLASEGGKPVRRASYHELTIGAARDLAAALQRVTGFEIREIPRGGA